MAAAYPTITVTVDRGTTVEIPDFASLYPLCLVHPQVTSHDCEHCAEVVFSPRMAFFLWTALDTLAQSMTGDLAETVFDNQGHADTSTWLELGLLPPAALKGRTREWVSRFISCFTDLATRLADGFPPVPTCTGEEMALHMAFAAAVCDAAAGTTAATTPWYEGFPESYELDLAFEPALQTLVEDDDILLLDDPDYADCDLATAQLGVVNLHPDKWFIPFTA